MQTQILRSLARANRPVLSDCLAIRGGPPVRTSPWPTYDKGDLMLTAAEEAAALRVVRSRRLFRYDTRPYAETETGRLETELAGFLRAPHVLACSSGTTAITLGLLAAGLPPGADVAVPAFTFAATPSGVLLAGGNPVVVDVDDDMNFDVHALARTWTPAMKAIVVVHMRGIVSDMEAILAFAREKDLIVVEDAVPACGVTFRGRRAGTWGDAGAFSMQSDKAINTGEGGFVALSDEAMLRRGAVLSGAYERRAFRHAPPADFDDRALPLFNYRLDEVRAAMARTQVARLDDKLARHRAVYEAVTEGLAAEPLIRVRQPVEAGAVLGNNLNFWIRGATVHQTCWVTDALRAEGIDVRQFGDPRERNVRCFWNWRFLWPDLDEASIRALAPNGSRLLTTCLDVPLSAALSPADQADVVNAILKVVRGFRARVGGEL